MLTSLAKGEMAVRDYDTCFKGPSIFSMSLVVDEMMKVEKFQQEL